MAISFPKLYSFSIATLTTCLVISTSSHSLLAQQPMRMVTPARAIRIGNVISPEVQSPQDVENSENAVSDEKNPATAGQPASGAASAKTPSLDEKRLALLMAAKFDRTPEGILKAWSQTESPSNQPKGENNEAPKPIVATVANAFQGFVVLDVDDATRLKVDQVVSLQQAPKEGEKETEAGKAEDENPNKATPENEIRLKILSIDGKQVSGKLVLPPKQSSEVKKPAEAEKTEGEKTEVENAEVENAEVPKSSADAADSNSKESDASPNQESDSAANSKSEQELVDVDKDDSKSEAARQLDLNLNQSMPRHDYPEIAAGDQYELSIVGEAEKVAAQSIDAQAKADVEQFTRDVTLGNWKDVKTFLASLSDSNKADDVYEKILKALLTAMPEVDEAQAAQQKSQLQQQGITPPTSYLTPDDLLALIDAAPKPISVFVPETKKSESDEVAAKPVASAPAIPNLPAGVTISPAVLAQLRASGQIPSNAAVPAASGEATNVAPKPNRHLNAIAQLIRVSKTAGYDFSGFIEALKNGTTHLGGEDPEKKLTASAVLISAAMLKEAESFLPPVESIAEQKEEFQLIMLRNWNTIAQANYRIEKTESHLNQSWTVSQDLLKHKKSTDADKKMALTQLIELSTIVEAEIGQKWLDESFTTSIERGMSILANLGSQSSSNARMASQVPESTRLKLLTMQNSSVEKFLQLKPEVSDDLRPILTLLAENWIEEAKIAVKNSTQNSRQGFMSIDMYGNYYWVDPNTDQRFNNGRRQRPIKIGDLLEIVPSPMWLGGVESSLLTEVKIQQAKLHLRINEEDKAFPFIESLAETHPDLSRELVHDFLRIWTSNHDPNTDRRQRNPYIYSYGFDQKADAIPLTRSKQERNLKELTQWIARIRKMPIKDVDEKLLANAFTTCHSTAEVYKLDRVKSVFGDLKELDPATIAELSQTMRENLSTSWRQVKLQEAMQTNRKLPDVQQEVVNGYATAAAMVEEALVGSPNNWQLNLAKACILFDQNAYSQSIKKSSEFSDRRDAAFNQFKLAAEKYIAEVPELEESKHSTDVFDRWFYASLGAVDLGQIKSENEPDNRQHSLIRLAIDSIPGEGAKSHMAKFANNLFTRMSPIKPELKFRYLNAGFEIVGDHPRAWEAKSLFDYYRDLVSEIKLDVALDGDADVGTNAFGLYVNIKHTVEIERESGGFGKYAQNQNSMAYAFNYGRPTEDYRDKFREGIDQALGEHFEVISVTFESADRMKSRPAPDGFRMTPYAYVLLKAKGTEVDRVAPLKLDLDFLDTSGYVVIPVESPALAIDCSGKGSTRPIEDLKVTQTLDERQSGEGKLIVEISASGKGLIPELDEIAELEVPDFEVVQIDDQGSLPTTFDEESSSIQILSDRSWTVEYRAKDASAKANTFAFGKSKREDAEIKYQRYEDADLVPAEPVMVLQTDYAKGSMPIWYFAAPLAALAFVGIGIVAWLAQPKTKAESKAFEVPGDINPFTVLSLLKEIKHRNGISSQQTEELDVSINRIESYYFGEKSGDSPGDLEQVAQTWVSRALGR